MRSSRKKKFSFVRTTVFVIFAVYAASLIFPLLWGGLNSFLTRAEFNMPGTAFKWPSSFNFINYGLAWKELSANGISMVGMTLNSVYYAGMKAFVSVLASAMAAYVITKYEFPGRKLIFTIAMAMLMLPMMGNMAPSLRFMHSMNAVDTPLYAILSASALGSVFVYINATFKGLSWEYAEAAFIDGAGNTRTFFQVMLPQVISPLAALFVSEFILHWNDSMAPLLFMPNTPTLASGLYVYQVVTSRAINYPLLFAALMMCLIPVLILYFAFQKNLMDLQLGGGIKG